VKLPLALLILFATTPVLGRDIVLPPLLPGEVESPAKPAALDLRAAQVNRCVDAQGKVTWQDLPCNPVAAGTRPSPAAEAGDVTDLAALERRSLAAVPPAAAAELPARGFGKALAIGAGKLGLLLLACFGFVRLVSGLRALYRHARPAAESRRYGPHRAS
jgi:hypothetical protein